MGNTKSKNVLLTIMGVLILVEILSVGSILVQSFEQAPSNIIPLMLELMSLAFVTLYGIFLYKKPHGNILKIAFILFSSAILLKSSSYLMQASDEIFSHILRLFAVVAICYCAGRLNRIEQNKWFFAIVEVIFVATTVVSIVKSADFMNFAWLFVLIDAPVIFTTLMIAYFVRFKEHKEAGLMDAPKE